MTSQHLGKHILYITLFILFHISLWANVKIEAPDSFYKGETVIFSITVSGNNIDFPQITDIKGIPVQNAGNSSSTRIINGVRSQSVTRSFLINSKEDITIPPIAVKIDGTTYKTKETIIKAKQVEKTKSNLYDLTISTDKTEVYVGEEIRFNLKFKYRKDLPVVDLNFHKPVFDNFWKKELNAGQPKETASYIEQELNYVLFPQKSGDLVIEPVKIDIATIDDRYESYGFFRQTATQTIPVFSNSIKLKVKPLPQNVKLIGDFAIISTLDKTSVKTGEAVSYKLTIKGRGNIDDIDELKLNIPDTTVYENPAKKQFNIENNRYGGIYSKSYSIVSPEDFVIPSINIKYFDKTNDKIKVLKTKEYKVTVKSIQNEKPKLQTAQPKTIQPAKTKQHIEEKTIIYKNSPLYNIIFFILGIAATMAVFALIKFIVSKKHNK